MRSCSRSEAGVVATVRFGLAGATGGAAAVENWKRLMSPQPASAIGAHSSAAAAQTRRLIPLSRGRADPSTMAPLKHDNDRALAPCLGMILSENRFTLFRIMPLFGGLIPAQHFDLSRPDHLDPRPGVRFDPATNTNPPILQGLEREAVRFDPRHHAP